MSTLFRSTHRFSAFLVVWLFGVCAPIALAADPPARILILPFAIHAEKDMDYLREGIADMLSTRLTVEDKTVMMDPDVAAAETADTSEFDTAEAAVIGQRTGADYVVFGSLTVVFGNLSTDIRLVDVKTGKNRVTYNQTGEDLGAVIGHIDLFAKQVKASLLGEKAVAVAPQSPPKKETTVAEQPQPPDQKAKGAPAATGVIIMPTDEQLVGEADSLWRSKRFNLELVGLDIGDVDGDGKVETVFIGRQNVFIFRLEANGIFRILAKIDNKGFNRHIHVGVGDINGNGVAEIFVSNLVDETGPPQSFVLEWNGRAFVRIAENQRWYYRVIKSGGSAKLFGQGRTPDEVFRPGIFEMSYIGGRYEPGQRVPLPYAINVYAFTYGDVMNDGSKAFVAFSKGAVPLIVDEFGKELWKGADSFGGNGVYIEYLPSYMGGDFNDDRTPDNYYLPNPVAVRDLNRDGFSEVITVNNQMRLGDILARIRSYKQGAVVSLDWTGSGLQKRWQSIDFTKFITDLIVGDFDNDGTEEIVFTVVSKTRSTFDKGKSYIGAIDIQRELATGKGG